MLVKCMPPALIYINQLNYSGGLNSDEMKLKLCEYFNNLTETQFEKSDIVNKLYENGATYVNLDMDISIVRYTSTMEKYTYTMLDTDQRYTIPDNTLARFFCTSTEMPGVQRV